MGSGTKPWGPTPDPAGGGLRQRSGTHSRQGHCSQEHGGGGVSLLEGGGAGSTPDLRTLACLGRAGGGGSEGSHAVGRVGQNGWNGRGAQGRSLES